ncbi:energy transducer TonB [Flavobacterium commune]|uniref:TonB C-terminal domain-containing protein n=1 Tax=Flavobacterium commune TaxID=1306519 RepID=A0A1D9PAX3_9FLAO|nr:energy transducer TonB [Flavobacterium commune]AOZ99721.1 hypothetical protein BIW12_09875 [Flavobacterium commune]
MKTKVLTTTLLLAITALFAQDNGKKLLLLDSLRLVTTDKNYVYIRTIEDYNIEKDLYAVSEYNKSGKINMKAFTKNKDILQLEGLRIDYYENGNKKQESNYTNNKLNGKKTDWYENGTKKLEAEYIIDDKKKKTTKLKINQFWDVNGVQKVTDSNGQYEEIHKEQDASEKTTQYGFGNIKNGFKDGIWQGWIQNPNIKYTENYQDGQFISGKTVDENNVETVYNVLEKKPEPKGGMESFYRYIGANYRTPNIEGLSGKIFLSFIIDKDGKIVEPKILRDIGYGTGEEAIRILKKYDGFTPGEQKGRKVRVKYSLPISIQAPRRSNQMQPSQPGTNMMRNTNPRW